MQSGHGCSSPPLPASVHRAAAARGLWPRFTRRPTLRRWVGSLAEPYVNSPAAAFLLRNATLTAVRNLKTSAGEVVGSNYIAGSPWPFYVDPNVAAMAANAEPPNPLHGRSSEIAAPVG
jgi:hypothetical protein